MKCGLFFVSSLRQNRAKRLPEKSCISGPGNVDTGIRGSNVAVPSCRFAWNLWQRSQCYTSARESCVLGSTTSQGFWLSAFTPVPLLLLLLGEEFLVALVIRLQGHESPKGLLHSIHRFSDWTGTVSAHYVSSFWMPVPLSEKDLSGSRLRSLAAERLIGKLARALLCHMLPHVFPCDHMIRSLARRPSDRSKVSQSQLQLQSARLPADVAEAFRSGEYTAETNWMLALLWQARFC